MGPKLIGLAAATVALASGHGHDAAPQREAISSPPHLLTSPPTPTPTPGRPGPPRAVRLTIGVSGDLLPHLPIVARAHALAGGGRHPGHVGVHAARGGRARAGGAPPVLGWCTPPGGGGGRGAAGWGWSPTPAGSGRRPRATRSQRV